MSSTLMHVDTKNRAPSNSGNLSGSFSDSMMSDDSDEC